MTTVRAVLALLILGLHAACAGTRSTELQVASPTPARTVRGTVAYRERLALPDDATVDVWITDIGSGIVTMAVLGETSVAARGRQGPLSFELPIDPARVNADRPYGIRAAIRAGGATLFETREPTPVLTQGHRAAGAAALHARQAVRRGTGCSSASGRWPGDRAQAAANMRFFGRWRAA